MIKNMVLHTKLQWLDLNKDQDFVPTKFTHTLHLQMGL